MLRSVQSTQRESASAPMTIAVLYAPLCRNCDAVLIPNKKPEHAAVRSKATAFVAPTLRATNAASPKRSSGDDVAMITRPTSNGSTPACSRASLAALLARSARP